MELFIKDFQIFQCNTALKLTTLPTQEYHCNTVAVFRKFIQRRGIIHYKDKTYYSTGGNVYNSNKKLIMCYIEINNLLLEETKADNRDILIKICTDLELFTILSKTDFTLCYINSWIFKKLCFATTNFELSSTEFNNFIINYLISIGLPVENPEIIQQCAETITLEDVELILD